MTEYKKIKYEPEFIELSKKLKYHLDESDKILEEINEKFKLSNGWFFGIATNNKPMIYNKNIVE